MKKKRITDSSQHGGEQKGVGWRGKEKGEMSKRGIEDRESRKTLTNCGRKRE